MIIVSWQLTNLFILLSKTFDTFISATRQRYLLPLPLLYSTDFKGYCGKCTTMFTLKLVLVIELYRQFMITNRPGLWVLKKKKKTKKNVVTAVVYYCSASLTTCYRLSTVESRSNWWYFIYVTVFTKFLLGKTLKNNKCSLI